MRERPLKVAVVTGGHPFDVQGLDELFRSLPGIDAYVQHIDNFAAIPQSIGRSEGNDFDPVTTRREYEVVVFYCMLEGEPKDKGVPWYRGAPKAAFDDLGQVGQGIFVWHHALLNYPEWNVWRDIVGIADRSLHDWSFGQRLLVEVTETDHPITQGLEPFECIDESYQMVDAGDDCEVLLTTKHPKSMHTLAWTRQYGNSRVFCLQLGHDKLAWSNPSFRTLIERGIRWCARD